MTVNATISDSLRQLIGKPAWGLHRSHGSMFLFDVGEAVPRSEKKTHGEWCFLFESCTWRFESIGKLAITSEDDSEQIESQFGKLQLGRIIEANYSTTSEQLHIAFDSGIALEVHPDFTEDDPESTEWIFFVPGDLAWGKTKSSLSIGSIYPSSAPN
jgi:hypothetical protein